MNKPVFLPGKSLAGVIPFSENHVHTTYSDGRNTIEEYVNQAVEKGVKSIVFTEHVNRNSSWFDEYINDVQKAKSKYGKHIKILGGIEAKALDYNGAIDATDKMIRASEMVVGVVHRYPNFRGGMLEFSEVDSSLALNLEYQAAKGLLENGKIHVLGHMGASYETRFGPFSDELLKDLIITARNKNRVVELNGRYHTRLEKMVGYCRHYNPWVSLGSDAHDISEIGLIYTRLKELNYS